jgi:hypothetical protein
LSDFNAIPDISFLQCDSPTMPNDA